MAFVIAAYAYENGFLSVKLQDVTQSKVLFQELAKGGYHKEIILSIPHIYIDIYLYIYSYSTIMENISLDLCSNESDRPTLCLTDRN